MHGKVIKLNRTGKVKVQNVYMHSVHVSVSIRFKTRASAFM